MSQLESKKRKRGEKVFRFKSFGENGYPVEFDGSFRENVEALVRFGYPETNVSSAIPSWSFQLEVSSNPPLHILLFVIEEPIEASLQHHCSHCVYVGEVLYSNAPHSLLNLAKVHQFVTSMLLASFWLESKNQVNDKLKSQNKSGSDTWRSCDNLVRFCECHVSLGQIEVAIDGFGLFITLNCSSNRGSGLCDSSGWGQNLICNKKYHFVLPSKDTMIALLNSEGPISVKGKLNMVDLQGHMMHGVFHSNGFGHLLCVNGMEAGSNLCGRQIMDFWDRLCTGLRARKVSLNDISHKRNMELRLINGVAYGEPWFGQWGYKFERGSYGVTEPMYQKAITTIKAMPLCIIVQYVGPLNHDLQAIVSRYQTISDYSLQTLGDLFHFMFELKTRLSEENHSNSYTTGIVMEPSCRWSAKRIEMATRVIVEALKSADLRWVSRQQVRDAARAYIGDTGLLDFVLKSLGNRIVGNYLVRRSLNPVTKVLEYCLEDVSNIFPSQERLSNSNSKLKCRYKITRSQITKDMYYFYKYIVISLQAAARIILDTKFLAKDYDSGLFSEAQIALGGKLKVHCTVVLKNFQVVTNEGISNATLPFESITLKTSTTFEELKRQVEKNFRELYWGLRGLSVESLLNLNATGNDRVFGVVEVGRKIMFEGSNNSNIGIELMYENGVSNRVIDCPCGTNGDDGERMVTCDICEVWQHTRCVKIPNNQEVPHIFLCNRCEHEIIISPSLP